MPSSGAVPEKISTPTGSIQGYAFRENLSLYASQHLLAQVKKAETNRSDSERNKKKLRAGRAEKKAQHPGSAPE